MKTVLKNSSPTSQKTQCPSMTNINRLMLQGNNIYFENHMETSDIKGGPNQKTFAVVVGGTCR
jgi:hypothetical protein